MSTGQVAPHVYFSTAAPRVQGKRFRHARLDGKVLCKKARASQHQLRVPPAWAHDEPELRAARAQGAEWLAIEDTESTRVFWGRLADFFAHGFIVNRGHGVQRALPIKFFQRLAPGETPVVQASLPGFADEAVAR